MIFPLSNPKPDFESMDRVIRGEKSLKKYILLKSLLILR